MFPSSQESPNPMAKIIYTHTDEAPLLATYSFRPIIQAYAAQAGVEVETRDISLAGRIIAQFPERLTEEQRIDDALAELGELATKPEANIIKLPNISASIPQLKAAIKELQEKGYDLPNYPENPQSDEDKEIRAKYDSTKTVLKDGVKVLAGEVVDGTFMNVAALRRFLAEQIARAKAEDVLFSVHLKATMMKVSDPIIFGHVVQAFFPTLFEQYGEALAAAGISPNDGLGALLNAVTDLPEGDAIKSAVDAGIADGPAMAMVDSDKGITNLHVPSDVIIDASMPAMIRTSGHMWGPDGGEADTLAVIPDSCYAGVYQTVIADCRDN